MRNGLVATIWVIGVLFGVSLAIAGEGLVAAVAGGHGLLTASCILVLVLLLAPDASQISSMSLGLLATLLQVPVLFVLVQFAPAHWQLPVLAVTTIFISAMLAYRVWRLFRGSPMSPQTQRAAMVWHAWWITLFAGLQYGLSPSAVSDDKSLLLACSVGWLLCLARQKAVA